MENEVDLNKVDEVRTIKKREKEISRQIKKIADSFLDAGIYKADTCFFKVLGVFCGEDELMLHRGCCNERVYNGQIDPFLKGISSEFSPKGGCVHIVGQNPPAKTGHQVPKKPNFQGVFVFFIGKF